MLAGFSVNSSMPVMDHLSVALRYEYHWNDIYNVAPDASPSIKDQAGEYVLSLVGYRLSYNGLDSSPQPTKGVYATFKQDATGAIGDSHFIRTEFSVNYLTPILHRQLMRPWIFHCGFSSGYLMSYSDPGVRINDRFFLGADDFRGFLFRGLGPRDRLTGDALGGHFLAKAVAQLDFPLVFASDLMINSLNLKGYTFIDAGTLFGVDKMSDNIVDSNQLRASVGVGVAWVLPVIGIPVRLDLSFPILRTNFDKVQYANIRFTN
jgi:outer membrane protein insertion porin family